MFYIIQILRSLEFRIQNLLLKNNSPRSFKIYSFIETLIFKDKNLYWPSYTIIVNFFKISSFSLTSFYYIFNKSLLKNVAYNY